ncbi:peptidase M15 [Bryobacterales bacterium F-183]|nr:peptidase M15 [Bryobacterales bacterium F-183]
MDALACASTSNAQAVVGVHAVQLKTGKVLHDQQGSNSFTPASNTKLFSAALALTRLGPDHTFETRLAADTEPNDQGVLQGDLYWVGGGDPTLGSRSYSRFRDDSKLADVLDQFVAAVEKRGIRHITGNIVGDETRFPRDLYPIGWTVDDAVADYGAPVSALTLHDNVQALGLSPWAVRFTPPLEYYTVFNQIRVGDEANIQVDRAAGGSRQLLLTGYSPGDKVVTELVAVEDPAHFAAAILHDALSRRGIRVDGQPAVRTRRVGEPLPPRPAVTFATRTSPPLIEVLRVIEKVSQNLFAELVLREVALVRSGEATRQATQREMNQFLWQVGVNPECCYFQDGSGLSRQTLVTPRAVAKVLAFMHRSEHRDAWLGLMPIGGVDGSLTRRFDFDKENGKRIRAKTGSLSHVAALSGYAASKTHGDVAFSIILNHFNGFAAEAREIIDKIAVAIAE